MSKESLAHFDEVVGVLENMSDPNLDTLIGKIGAIAPWQGSPPGSLGTDHGVPVDVDGFKMSMVGEDFSYTGFQALQRVCWQKFNKNPFVFTTVMDTTGRLTGYGFDQGSTYQKADDLMQKVWKDPRNMLVSNFSKYIARDVIQGELFFVFTIHKDGFVEVDFISPSAISGFANGSGILTAENKPLFPLMYRVETLTTGKLTKAKFIPSINMAYYPQLWKDIKNHPEWSSVVEADIVGKSTDKTFSPLGGYTQFMVQFDQGLVTSRNVGRLKVILEWLEHYDNIKKWELDHKKSSGAYLWSIEVADRAAFRLWLGMTDDERAKTGLMQHKTPGMTVFLPPGFKLQCNNPKLSSITNQDDDILRMVSAGLNTSEDMMTGSSSGQTYGGVKMSRGPINDRIADQIANLERFMIYTFWRGVFFLHSKTGHMSPTVSENRAYKFENGEPKFKKVQVEAHETVLINWPLSEMGDLESKVKAMLGVKHGSLSQTLGIANEDVAKRIGFQNYHRTRLKLATEEKMYPKLKSELEAEQAAEGAAEPGVKKIKPKSEEPVKPKEEMEQED